MKWLLLLLIPALSLSIAIPMLEYAYLNELNNAGKIYETTDEVKCVEPFIWDRGPMLIPKIVGYYGDYPVTFRYKCVVEHANH